MTIEEKLEKYKENNISFYEAYLDCMPIEEVEGEILENATYSGYSIKDNYGNRYFTDYGIRGCSHGTFKIINGEPIEMITLPKNETLSWVGDMIAFRYSLDDYEVYDFLKREWYNLQEKLKKN